MSNAEHNTWLCRNCNTLVSSELDICPSCKALRPENTEIEASTPEGIAEEIVVENYANATPATTAKYNFRESVLNTIADISLSLGLFLVLAAFIDEDTEEDLEWTARKIAGMRIFDDENGVMNRSVLDTQGEILVVSQFTLHASTKKGNRPSYFRAAPEAISRPMYEKFVQAVAKASGKEVATGEFGADMKVALVNDGPVTIWIDSRNRE